MSPKSLFSRAARYVPSEGSDPRENRLTEILASVLERVPGLARVLALTWLDPEQLRNGKERACNTTAAAWERINHLDVNVLARVRTQVAVGGGFLDLELRFPTATEALADDVVVWVEVKHGVDPERQQLTAYQQAMCRLHRSDGRLGEIVLLDAARKLPRPIDREVPREVPQRSWERTGRTIEQFNTTAPVERWLCEELSSYLREESLMYPDALGPEHLTALAYAGEAKRSLEAICEHAQVRINNMFRESDQPPGSKPRYGEDFVATWVPLTSSALRWRDAWLEWHLKRHGGDGLLEVRAGLSAPKRSTFDAELQRQLEQGIAIDGTLATFRSWHGPKERLMRVARPQDVLVGADLDTQAESLARWVTSTLREVERLAEV